MPSDQLLAELINDPRTLQYQADQLKLWNSIKADHEAYTQSAEAHGASETAAERAADDFMRGRINFFMGSVLPHTREVRAREFMAAAPKEWGSRSEMLLDLDSLVLELLAKTYHIVAWNVKVDSFSKAIADNPSSWRAWLTSCLDRLGAKTLVDHVIGKVSAPKPGLGLGLPTPPPPPGPTPGPAPAPTPTPSPTPTPTPTPAPTPSDAAGSPWRILGLAGLGAALGGSIIGGILLWRR
jgi:hypothetical protein